MSNHLPGNLAEIFPLRFRLRQTLRFEDQGEKVLAQRSDDGRHYALNRWQHAMLERFDGQLSFEAVAREVYDLHPGSFTSIGLLNFYGWLYQEDLVLCECESVFELVSDEEEPETRQEPETPRSLQEDSGFKLRLPRRETSFRLLKAAATVAFCLAVLRISYVAAPLFEPPIDRLYAGVENFFLEDARPALVAESEQSARDTSVRDMQLAGRAIQPGLANDGDAPSAAGTETARPETGDSEGIDVLRQRLAECRIRRDEFYLQNDEAGYRREVEKMTEIARKIGRIESEGEDDSDGVGN